MTVVTKKQQAINYDNDMIERRRRRNDIPPIIYLYCNHPILLLVNVAYGKEIL